jgi:hypothetical protein
MDGQSCPHLKIFVGSLALSLLSTISEVVINLLLAPMMTMTCGGSSPSPT